MKEISCWRLITHELIVMDVSSHLARRQQIIGVLPSPPGITPNFEHPTSHGHVLAVASVVCVVIATIFVAARLFTKVVVSRAPGWDDGTRAQFSFMVYIAHSITVTAVIALVRFEIYLGYEFSFIDPLGTVCGFVWHMPCLWVLNPGLLWSHVEYLIQALINMA